MLCKIDVCCTLLGFQLIEASPLDVEKSITHSWASFSLNVLLVFLCANKSGEHFFLSIPTASHSREISHMNQKSLSCSPSHEARSNDEEEKAKKSFFFALENLIGSVFTFQWVVVVDVDVQWMFDCLRSLRILMRILNFLSSFVSQFYGHCYRFQFALWFERCLWWPFLLRRDSFSICS